MHIERKVYQFFTVQTWRMGQDRVGQRSAFASGT